MKKILLIVASVLSILFLMYFVFFNRNSQKCEGLYCDFLSQIDKEFELTGGEKDQGYLFLRDHSEQDTTTNRVIIRSIDGIYFTYPAESGWYAQQKGADIKITLNELGHALAEKEIDYEAKIQELIDSKLNEFTEVLKRNYSWNLDRFSKIGVSSVDTAIFNNLKVDTLFLADELKNLRRGEMPFYDFSIKIKESDNLLTGGMSFAVRPKIGFYSKNKVFYPICDKSYIIPYIEIDKDKLKSLDYNKIVDYLIKKKIVQTSLTERSSYDRSLQFRYECNPMIYVPSEKRWYGPDKLKEILEKYFIVIK